MMTFFFVAIGMIEGGGISVVFLGMSGLETSVSALFVSPTFFF